MKSLRPLACAAFLPLALGSFACSGASRDAAGPSSPAEQRASWGLDAPPPAPGGEAASAAPSTALGADEATGRRQSFDDRPAAEPQARPGLGTEFGETRTSHISSSPFSRADAKNPFATGALFYNDEEGARAMATASGFRRTSEGGIEIGGGILTARLKGDDGRFLSGFEAGGKEFVTGMAGDRYSIVVESHVPARLEIVVSVDGLDVIDGRPASFSKRGYLLDPHGSIEIDGFRQSMETVAAFRFGAVRDSYAEKKHGDARNVGVIGLAVFHERGDTPGLWGRGEVRRRLDANPFPGQFATPPGR
jgi:hypothetical protein